MGIHRLAPGAAVPAVFDTVLARFVADAPTVFGAGVRLEPVAFELRPFSHLLRIAIVAQDDVTPARHCFLKIFKPKAVPDGEAQMRRRVEHDFATTRRIHDALAEFPRFGAVRPLACYGEHLAVVTEESVGETLLARLEARAAWFPSEHAVGDLCETMRAAGGWLQAFQTIDPGEERIDLDDIRDYIDLRLRRLVAAGSPVVTTAARDRLLEHITRLSAAIPQEALRSVVVHADLAPGNVLVSGERIVVLDFAMTTRGTRLHDLTRLYLQTDLLRAKPQFRPVVLSRLLQALLEGFEPGLTAQEPLFRLLSLLHRVNHLATLTLNPARFPTNLYNRRLRRLHATWLLGESCSETPGRLDGARR